MSRRPGTDSDRVLCRLLQAMSGSDGLGPRVRDNNDGTICVEYHPKCEGRHEVLMSHNGSAVKGKSALLSQLFMRFNASLDVFAFCCACC